MLKIYHGVHGTHLEAPAMMSLILTLFASAHSYFYKCGLPLFDLK
jgi:hypothetical protein